VLTRAVDQEVQGELIAVRKEADALRQRERELTTLVANVVATESVLHEYLKQNAPANLRDFVAEAGRQVTGFNEEIKKADQANPVVERLVKLGESAQERISQVDENLTKFLTIWRQVNSQGN
jgi:hypothetical protein